ncbi:ABC transporter substrate-binding protein [Virgibacillus oceani]
MKVYFNKLSIFSLIALLFIVGCNTETSEGNTNDGAADNDNRLIIGQSSDVETMDPQAVSSTTADRLFKNMHAYMFYWDENVDLKNGIVEEYEQKDDETWVFTLKEGVKFHNGDPLTAEDVQFSLERVMEDSSLKQFLYFNQLEEVNVLDEYELEIKTDGPMTTLLTLLAKSGSEILPKNYIDELGMDEYQNNPIGAGPYKFVEWQKDAQVTLEPYEDYYDGDPEWDEVILRSIPENSTRVGELISGDIDIITDVPPNEWERVNAETDKEVIEGATTRVMLLIVRLTEGIVTSDPKVREAIELAIDNKAIVDNLFDGKAVPVRSRVPENVFGSDPDLYDDYLYDVEKAKELLEEAGYSDGIEITMTAPNGNYPLDGEVAEMIAAMLGEVGINVNLELLESSAFSEVYNNGTNEELLMIGLADGLLDASYSLTHYTEDRATGQTDFYNEEAEDLYYSAIGNSDEEERIEQYQRIQQIAAEERPHIFLYQLPAFYGVDSNVEFEPEIYEYFRFDDITKK